MKRRDFLKLSAASVATLVIGSRIPEFWVKNAFAATQNLEIFIEDALKDMVTHNSINTAQCYFWVYRMRADGVDIPPDCPGPTILATKGDSINVSIVNNLDEPHAFFIPGIFDSGPIAPGQTVTGTISLANAPSGAQLYFDNLNEPVNRMMGLHGAIVVRPNRPVVVNGNKITPYDSPTPHVQNLFNDFGSTDHFPGLAWHEGDPATLVPGMRQYIWLTHEASPNLFREVGSLAPGEIYPAQQFVNKFLKDPFQVNAPNSTNGTPQYFTINGQSGFFAHDNPTITPMGRVGEPCVVHLLNAGLWTHSMHLHANHFYVTSVNGVVQQSPIWVDVFSLHPMDSVDYTVPFMRPPDVPNARGIGRPDTPLIGVSSGRPVWPPVEEFEVHMPEIGAQSAFDRFGNPIDLAQRMSPLCFPMHDHSEPSQTAQGGNYNLGLISGIYFTGDRNTPGHMDFPMDEDFDMMFRDIRGISNTTNNAPRPATDAAIGAWPEPGSPIG